MGYSVGTGDTLMSGDTDLKPVMTFLGKLARNNNRAWFEAHRGEYEKSRLLFEAFVGELILGLGRFDDIRGVTPKDCIMRIYRDVRFTKDKSPYKTGMGASMGPGGRKAYRIQLLPAPRAGRSLDGGGRTARARAGADRTRSARRSAVRRALSRRSSRREEFKRHFGEVEGERLKTAPKGYDRSHPEIDLLRLKEVVAMHKIPDARVAAPDLGGEILKVCAAMKPFLEYLRAVIP